MFDLLLVNLRSQGLKVGLGEWLTFLDGLNQGLVVDTRTWTARSVTKTPQRVKRN